MAAEKSKSGKPQKKRINSRQRAFLKAYAKGKTLKEAALQAGYSPKNAAQSGFQALKGVQGRIPELMDELGLWLANCYFAHNSLRFPALLPFFNASSLRPFHPPNRRPDPVAPTWRRPFPRCRVLSAQPPVVRNNSVDFKVQPIREANPAYPL